MNTYLSASLSHITATEKVWADEEGVGATTEGAGWEMESLWEGETAVGGVYRIL